MPMRLRPISIAVCALAIVTALAGGRDALAQARGRDGVIRTAFPVAESGFDPQAVSDAYSADLCAAIFEPLYRYDYFARPVRLEPAIAAALPEIADGGRTYTIRIKHGIRFTPDPAFNGKPRELVADDYVFAMKRVLDPKLRSYWLYILEHQLAGVDAVLADARKRGQLDYAAPIEGVRALDRYTLQLKFVHPNYGFAHWLTTINFVAVAHEVVDAYKDASNRVMENPVGYGPYRLAEWRRSQRVVLEANPDYRDVRYPEPAAGSDAADAAIAKGLAGRRLPLAKRVEVAIIEEAQPRLLAFQNGEIDYVSVPSSLAKNVLDGAKLKPGARDEELPAAAGDRAVAVVHVLQSGRSGRRRLHAGEARAAPRDRDGVRSRHRRARARQRPAGAGDAARAAPGSRP